MYVELSEWQIQMKKKKQEEIELAKQVAQELKPKRPWTFNYFEEIQKTFDSNDINSKLSYNDYLKMYYACHQK